MDPSTVALGAGPSVVAVESQSAVAVFSKLVSRLDRAPTVGRPGAGLSSLPTEILYMIFRFVFESCVHPEDGARGDDLALWRDDDPTSPSLFPYALACVCVRWSRALRAFPVFWTRVVIALDAVAPSLDAARSTLAWAGGRPLKVVVTRHRGTSEDDDSERASVGQVVAFLRPHVEHVWSLSFDVEHSSSMSCLWRENACAGRLEVLALTSRANASRTFRPFPPRSDQGEFESPLLRELVLGSCFLKDPLTVHPRWFRHITSLTIRGDAAASGGHSISLYGFLRMLDEYPSVRELTVEDAHFDDNAPPSLFMLRPVPPVLRFQRVTGRTALRDILVLTRSQPGVSRVHEDVTIVDCAVQGFRELHPHSVLEFSSTSLTLASMRPSEAIQDVVSRWNGERLTVIDCPRMSRAFLDRLHGEMAPTRFSCLRVVDCDAFHAGDVVSLVRSRETEAIFMSRMGVSDANASTALAELSVRGRGPPISAKRATWLAGHVATFFWDTVARDGLRYLWDRATGGLRVFPASAA